MGILRGEKIQIGHEVQQVKRLRYREVSKLCRLVDVLSINMQTFILYPGFVCARGCWCASVCFVECELCLKKMEFRVFWVLSHAKEEGGRGDSPTNGIITLQFHGQKWVD